MASDETTITDSAEGLDQAQSGTDESLAAATQAPLAKAAPRRRATKKASAPDPDAALTGSADGADVSADAVPARKAVRRSRKKTEVVPEETSDSVADAGTPAAEESVENTPRKRARRATKKAAVPAPEVSGEDAESDSESDSESDGVVESEPEAPKAPDTLEAPVEAAPAPATGFGLLFQAPDTSVRRSRRATSPAAAPNPVVAEVATEGTVEATVETTVEAPTGSRSGTSSRRRSGRALGAVRVAESPDPVSEEQVEADPSTDDQGVDGTGSEESGGESSTSGRSRRRRGGRGRRARGTGAEDEGAETSEESSSDTDADGDSPSAEQEDAPESATSRRRRRRRRGSAGESDDPPGTVTRVREPRTRSDEPTAVKGSTRLEAKKQRRREGREAGRRRTIITEAEFLARREAVDRVMVVRGQDNLTQIGVLEDGVLVEHYLSRETSNTMVGNVYLGRVQNVLPSMEAAFVDIGKGRNAVLYAGEVNWDAAGLEVNQAKRIENALTSGDTVLVQVTKDPIGHKGARLTSQISLPGRFLVYVPEGSMTGISRKLPDTERARLKGILKEIVPDSAGVIVRTAAEGASEEELRADVERLTKAWEKIQKKAKSASSKKAGSGGAPMVVHGEPDLTVRVIRDIFTEDFSQLVVSGEKAWEDVSEYVEDVAPDLAQRLTRWTSEQDVFTAHRVQEQIAKAMDRKVWLPSGGSLVIDRTEAMTVVDVNTGKFVGSGGNLEETVTKNNIEAAEEIVRQLRLRDIGGIIVIDFIDMVLESNRDLVVRRLLECLGRDRTKHQVAEVTSLGLVQMTRKRVGSGLIEVFSESCEHCAGRGIVVHSEPLDKSSAIPATPHATPGAGSGSRTARSRRGTPQQEAPEPERKPSGPTAAQIAAAAHAAAIKRATSGDAEDVTSPDTEAPSDPTPSQDAPVDIVREVDGADHEAPLALTEPDGLVAVNEQVPPMEAEAAPSMEAEPAPSGRRRRGRVVAPAGPPRAADGAADLESTPSEQ